LPFGAVSGQIDVDQDHVHLLNPLAGMGFADLLRQLSELGRVGDEFLPGGPDCRRACSWLSAPSIRDVEAGVGESSDDHPVACDAVRCFCLSGGGASLLVEPDRSEADDANQDNALDDVVDEINPLWRRRSERPPQEMHCNGSSKSDRNRERHSRSWTVEQPTDPSHPGILAPADPPA